ncbi:MAG: peptidylprolyl isomerase [Bacteroidia bacterium]|nr:peptidylprolyl isomerase [Bacteroidia bacterium]
MNKIVIIACVLFSALSAFSQAKKPVPPAKDPVIFTYGKNKVLLSEFEKGLFKNNHIQKDKPTPEKVDEYLELYKKFKLKVQDAYDMGMDTTDSYRKEMSTYRKQLAKPYLTDKAVTDQLVEEAYERMKYEFNSTHILILVNPDDAPADTLAAFKKISNIRKEIMDGTIDFANAAVNYSEDPSAKDNKGELGYFTVFQLVYPYESMAYNIPVNQVSPIFRTDYGYHIIKVLDRRPAKGEMRASQIMLQINPTPLPGEEEDVKKKIDEIYKKIQAGEKFEDLVVRFSDDQSAVRTKGEMNPFTMTSRLPQEFKDAAFALSKNGDVSAPVKTSFGWHIIKRIELKPIGEFNDLKNSISTKISRDSRSQKNTIAVVNEVKKQYQFKEIPASLSGFIAQSDSNVLQGTYSYKTAKNDNTPLFFLDKKPYTYFDFGTYLSQNNTQTESKSVEAVVKNKYKEFVEQTILGYYEKNLEKTKPAFASLYKEYKEGILLFNLTNQKVWAKSIEDTTGLKNYYDQNKEKYKWSDRYDATIFNCSDKAVAESVSKYIEKGFSVDSILKLVNASNPLNATAKHGKFEKGDNDYADKLFEGNYKDSKSIMFNDTKAPTNYIVVAIYKFIPAGYKQLEEARGPIASDYQEKLETEWIKSLMKKYPVVVNQKTLADFKARVAQ